MTDKRTAQILTKIATICEDGSYKIIEKKELEKDASKISELDYIMRHLKNSEMIDIKYSDETQYCVSVLPKGRVTVEDGDDERKPANTKLLLTAIVVATAAFFGALLGTIIGGLL